MILTSKGLTTPEMVQAALREDTILASVMHANNEIGVVNDIAGIGEICRAAGVLFMLTVPKGWARYRLIWSR